MTRIIAPEAIVTDMGTFRADIEIENPAAPGSRLAVLNALVDTWSELTWVPAAQLESIGIPRKKQLRFVLADGRILERWVGVAVVYAAGTSTGDDVVFAEPGDSVLMGARSLEGLNVRVDPLRKELIDAGPAPAAAAA
jgi:predicted aspartyl protease